MCNSSITLYVFHYSYSIVIQVMMEVESEGPRTLDSVYIRGEYVANGSFGHVCKGVSRSNPNRVVAIKEIDRRKFHPENLDILVKTVQREIESNEKIRTTKCPFIVEFIEYFESEDVVSFIFQFCEKTLLDLIYPYSKPMFFSKREYILIKVLYEMLLTLRVLESMHMIHRDIKPENILICEGVTKLGDFGFCREINQNLTSGRGSLRTTAPESHTSTTYKKCDIWSLGVTIHTLLYGVEPFEEKLRNNKDPLLFRDTIKSKGFCVEIRSESRLSEVLMKMIVVEESQRSSVSQLLGHPIFQLNKINSTSDWMREWILFSSLQTLQSKSLESTILAIIASVFSECRVSYQLHKTQGKQIFYFLSIFQTLQIFVKMLFELKVISTQIMRFIEFINNHYNQSFIQGLIRDLKITKKSMGEGFQKLYRYILSGNDIAQKIVELRNLCSKKPEAEVKSIVATNYKDFVIFPTLNKIIDHLDKYKWGLNNIIAIAFKEDLALPKFYFDQRLEYHQHISIF